jgi:two-component system, sensor histidine kinase and response regulator
MRILVVDDDTVFCTVASMKLGALKMAVTEAHDGLSAWATVQSTEFDLALIDLGLPGLDGLALIENIRRLPKAQQMPIIVITGRDDREAVDSAFAAGATFFLTKPINWSLIEHQIRCVTRVATSEKELRLAYQRIGADNRIKDTVIGRLNLSLRPLAKDLNCLALEIMKLAKSGAPQSMIVDHAAMMVSDAERLEVGLTTMTAFAGAVTSGSTLVEEPVDVAALFAVILKKAVRQGRARDVRVRLDLAAGDLAIICDPERLALAIYNLVDNAVRFAPPKSTVILAAHKLEDQSLYVSVDDDGCGIEPDHLVQLLSPLIGVDNGSRFDGQLAGMGLVTAKQIIEAHGGILEVRSVPRSGTTAILHLPASRTLGSKTEVNEISENRNEASYALRCA